MTQKLYDNGHIHEFDATVISCNEAAKGFELVLDRTAFFPNGGGQLADGGKINLASVIDVNETDGVIIHTVDKAFMPGETVHGKIDWLTRFGRMQNHTGEHIVCGVAHRLFGCENTGFHMGTQGITADLSVLLDENQIRQIELEANRAVFENVPVTIFYPDENEIKSLAYRSKLELTENVRLVKIDGYDLCACCAPHVCRTGEIGLIKILEHYSHRGGTRILLRCGYDALADYNEKSAGVAAVSALLCARQNEIAKAVEDLKAEKARLDYELEALKLSRLNRYIDRLQPSKENVCVFADDADADGLREIVNKGKELCSAVFAAFSADENGYKYCMGSNNTDLRLFAKEFNCALSGRGGGRPEMIQGSVAAKKDDIISFLNATEQ